MNKEQYEKKLDGYLNAILASAHSEFSDWYIDKPEEEGAYSDSIVTEFENYKMTIYENGEFALENEYEDIISDSSHAQKCQKIYNAVTSRIYEKRIEALHAFVDAMSNTVCSLEEKCRKEEEK